jgi:hypothetical protein
LYTFGKISLKQLDVLPALNQINQLPLALPYFYVHRTPNQDSSFQKKSPYGGIGYINMRLHIKIKNKQ